MADRRVRVWRQRGDRFREELVAKVVAHGGGSIHVWGAIWTGGRSELVVLQQNVTGPVYRDILHNHLATIEGLPPNWILQDDNARPHRSQVVQQFKETSGIQSLPWPARSPDLNPIEHVWDILGRRVRQHHEATGTLVQLSARLVQEWNNIPQALLDTLVHSMTDRVRAVISSKGTENCKI